MTIVEKIRASQDESGPPAIVGISQDVHAGAKYPVLKYMKNKELTVASLARGFVG